MILHQEPLHIPFKAVEERGGRGQESQIWFMRNEASNPLAVSLQVGRYIERVADKVSKARMV